MSITAPNTRICKECETEKPYIQSEHKVYKDGRKRYHYRNLSGGRWRGTTCSDCHNVKHTCTVFAVVERTCRRCGDATPNYFSCVACAPKTDAVYYMDAMGVTI